MTRFASLQKWLKKIFTAFNLLMRIDGGDAATLLIFGVNLARFNFVPLEDVSDFDIFGALLSLIVSVKLDVSLAEKMKFFCHLP